MLNLPFTQTSMLVCAELWAFSYDAFITVCQPFRIENPSVTTSRRSSHSLDRSLRVTVNIRNLFLEDIALEVEELYGEYRDGETGP